jgi:GNAT superfamily N-acetyltransferase
MVTVRKAKPSDNETLLDIQRRSPQGTSFVFRADSSPNYFNRTKPYDDGHVFVAEEDGQVVGSTSCAFLDTVVSGIPCKASYGYGLMVDPNHRRKGIATQLGEQVRPFINDAGVDLHFVMIVEGNTPSINLVNKMGFTLLHDFLRVSVFIHEGHEPSHPECIREMEANDAGDIVSLLNDFYRGYDLYRPFTEERFLAEIARYPFFEMEDLKLYENESGIQACLGIWNYNEITRYSVLKMPQEMINARNSGENPFLPELGSVRSIYFSHYPAYRDQTGFNDLIRFFNESLRERGAHQFMFPVNADTPLLDLLTEFPHNVSNTHIYAKPMERREFPNFGMRHIYIEPAHI